MSISSTGNSSATVTGTGSNTSTSGSNNIGAAFASQLGPSAFLQLLTTQLANQDPLNPMDDTQSVAQLAQFSSLQAQTNLNSSFTTFANNFAALSSGSLIGKTVTANSAGNTGGQVTGTVNSVGLVNGATTFTMKDSSGNVIDSGSSPANFNLSQILSIQS